MDIIIQHNKEIHTQLVDIQTNIENKKLSKPIIEKIGLVNSKLLEISEKLSKLNIQIKKDLNINLEEKEIEYLRIEKQSNELISNIMPFITLLSLNN